MADNFGGFERKSGETPMSNGDLDMRLSFGEGLLTVPLYLMSGLGIQTGSRYRFSLVQ